MTTTNKPSTPPSGSKSTSSRRRTGVVEPGRVTVNQRRQLKLVGEMQIEPDQFLAECLERGRMPSKRYRVEGSPAGASRLLTEDDAVAARRRYGGTVRELFTAAAFHTLLAKKRNLPACTNPTCNAQAGDPCRDRMGVRPAHGNRIGRRGERVSAHALAAQDMGPCPTCGVAAGKPCRKDHGKGDVRPVHKKRKAAGAAATTDTKGA